MILYDFGNFDTFDYFFKDLLQSKWPLDLKGLNNIDDLDDYDKMNDHFN